jgi:hypothetical protein
MNQRAIEVVVGADGNVASDALAPLGVRPGDHLRIVPIIPHARKSFLGAFPRAVGFTQNHLNDLRHEMSIDIGEDIES